MNFRTSDGKKSNVWLAPYGQWRAFYFDPPLSATERDTLLQEVENSIKESIQGATRKRNNKDEECLKYLNCDIILACLFKETGVVEEATPMPERMWMFWETCPFPQDETKFYHRLNIPFDNDGLEEERIPKTVPQEIPRTDLVKNIESRLEKKRIVWLGHVLNFSNGQPSTSRILIDAYSKCFVASDWQRKLQNDRFYTCYGSVVTPLDWPKIKMPKMWKTVQ